MVWMLPQSDLPILTPGQMNPMNQAFQSALQAYTGVTEAKNLQDKLQADIASKAAYAAYTPGGYASKIISNPEIFWSLPKEQREQLMSTVANMPANPVQALRERTGNKGGPLTQMWEWAMGGNQQQGRPQQSMQQGNQPPQQAPSQGTYPNSNIPVMQGDMGSGSSPGMSSDQAAQVVANRGGQQAGAFQDEIEKPLNPALPSSYNQYLLPNGQINTSNPAMNSLGDGGSDEANRWRAEKHPSPLKKEMEERIKTENELQSSLWGKRIEKYGSAIDQTDEALTAIKSMENLYPKIDKYQKGFLFGNVPAGSSGPASTFDTFAKIVSTSNLRALQTGHITNVDFAIGDQLKANRTMSKDQFKNIIEYQKGIKERGQEHIEFDNQAKKTGLSPQEADARWQKYIKDKPFYNAEKNRIIQGNMDKWKPYLKGNAAAGTSPAKTPINKVPGDQGYVSMDVDAKIVPMVNAQGEKVDVHPSRIQEAIADGFRQVG